MLMHNREPVLPIDMKHNLDKYDNKERENTERDGDKERPFNLEFLNTIFSSVTKVKQQSRMMEPTILKLLRKNKNEIMTVEICVKQKLKWMILCY